MDSEVEDVSGAYSLTDPTNNNPDVPPMCLFRNYLSIESKVGHITERTYESPFKWYFITFKPFNSTYLKHLDFYKSKGLDHCRKKVGKVKAYIMTKEIMAEKQHINMLCVCDRPLDSLLHEKKTSKYMIFAEEAQDRDRVLQYIIKESKQRYFRRYEDYNYVC